MTQRLIVLIMLAAFSWEDILHRRIFIQWLVYFAVAGILCSMIIIKQPFTMMVLGAIPGLVILVISIIFRGSIGLGDGLLLMVSGIYLGVAGIIRIIVYAVFLSAFCALYLYFGKKKDKGYEMPFVPFILASFLIDTVFGEW